MTWRPGVLALLLSCSSKAPPPVSAPSEPHWSGSLSPAPRAGAAVVATVNGDSIYVDDVETQARAAGQTAEQALDALVGATLLAQEAQRRGLADDPDVVETRQREQVRVLLARGFEPSFAGPESIPKEEIEALLRREDVASYYDHEEYHACAWARFKLAKTATPADDEAAHQKALQTWAAAIAAQPKNKEEFYAAVKPFGAYASSPFATTREHGPGSHEFAGACYSVSQPGQIATPTRTEWGWDILFLDSIIPERHLSRAEAEVDLRKGRFDASRRMAFKRWVDQLVAGHRIVKDEARLEAVQVDSLVGMP